MHHDQMKELCEKLDSLHQISEAFQAIQAGMGTPVTPDGIFPVDEKAGDSPPLPKSITTPRITTNEIKNDSSPASVIIRESHPKKEITTEDLRAKIRTMVEQSDNSGVNAHEWLIDRIAAIEAEQRTRWQRILDLMREKLNI